METKSIGKKVVRFRDGSQREIEVLIPTAWASFEQMVSKAELGAIGLEGNVIIVPFDDQPDATELTLFILFPDSTIEPEPITESEAKKKGFTWGTDLLVRVVDGDTNKMTKVYRVIPDGVN